MTQTSSPLQLQFNPPRRGKPPRHFADLTGAERQAALAELGEKPFRAKQLATHYFTHLTCDPATMTDLPVAGRDALVENFFPPLLTAARVMRADGGTTVKTLWHLFDAAKVESVLMRYPDRATLCVSSQAGCGTACPATSRPRRSSSRSGSRLVPWPTASCRADRPGSATWCSWAWANRSRTTAP